jgi:hypothetical protein
MMVGRSRAFIFFRGGNKTPRAYDRYVTVALMHITRLEPLETAGATTG